MNNLETFVNTKSRSGVMCLRLNQDEAAKLRFIAKNSPISQHRFVLNLLTPALNEEYEKLTLNA